MFSEKDRVELLEGFRNMVKENVDSTCSDIDLVKFMKEDKTDVIRNSILKIQSNIIASLPTSFEVPKVSLHITMSGKDAVDVVTISMSNKFTAVKKFKFQHTITKHNADTKSVVNMMLKVYESMLVDAMIDQNLEVLNNLYKKLVKNAGLSYEIRMVSPFEYGKKKLAMISDDEVVFVIDEDRAFGMHDLLILCTPDDVVSEDAINEVIEIETKELAKCQTAEQLVAAHGGSVIMYLSDINKQVKPMTLIRKVSSYNVETLRGTKDVLAYYEKDGIFALVARKDGEFEVVLSPFNTSTLERVDFDVLKAIK